MVKLETGKYTPISYLVVKVLVVCHLSSRWQCCLLSVNDFPLNGMIFFFSPKYNKAAFLFAPFPV